MRGNSAYGFIGMHCKQLTDRDIRLIRMLEYEHIVKENRHILMYVPLARLSHTEAVVRAYQLYLRVCGTWHDIIVCPLPERNGRHFTFSDAVSSCVERSNPATPHHGSTAYYAGVATPDTLSAGLRAPPPSP